MKNPCMIVMVLAMAAFSSIITGCQTGYQPISQRDLYEKEGKSANLGHRRPVEDGANGSPEIYLKRQNIEIVPQETKNYTGSLFSLKRPNAYLVTDIPRGELGDFLDVQVAVNRKDQSASAPAADPAAPAADPAAAKGNVQDELIAALPKLEPGTADAKMPSIIKMKVVRQLENGDVIVEAARASENEWEANSIRAMARVPREKLLGTKAITTGDLADVHWYESQNGEQTQRESLDWEDEYSMRWAGFDEAKSKVAIDLENKRKDLEKVRDRLKDKIVVVGKERNKLAAERQKVDALRQEAEDKLSELSNKNKQQGDLIEEQKAVIKKQEQIITEAAQARDSANLNDAESADKKDKKPETPRPAEARAPAPTPKETAQ